MWTTECHPFIREEHVWLHVNYRVPPLHPWRTRLVTCELPSATPSSVKNTFGYMWTTECHPFIREEHVWLHVNYRVPPLHPWRTRLVTCELPSASPFIREEHVWLHVNYRVPPLSSVKNTFDYMRTTECHPFIREEHVWLHVNYRVPPSGLPWYFARQTDGGFTRSQKFANFPQNVLLRVDYP